jgi:imidazolonepropionase-like amidohydrolase
MSAARTGGVQAFACRVTLVMGVALAAIAAAQAQVPSERTPGLADHTPRWHALAGARLVLAPGQVVESGTLVMRDGLIVAAGRNVAVPVGARVWRLDGRTVYAGFIDLNSTIGVPAALRPLPPSRPAWGPGAELPEPAASAAPVRAPVARGLAARNPFVRAEQDIASQLDWRVDEVRAARALGFATVLAGPATGVIRGQGALVNLLDPDESRAPRAAVLQPRITQHMAHEIQRGRDAGYPSSLMGSIALLRQTLHDARWHRAAVAHAGQTDHVQRVEPNASLEALASVLDGRQPVVYATEEEQDYLRVARVRDEFGLRAIVLGNGHEYRRAAQIKALGLPLVVPLTYPSPPAVDDPDAALDVPLDELQHWEQAPSNLTLLHRHGVSVAITSAGLRDAQREFWPRLRQAVRRGLPADQALAALTLVPAQWLGQQSRLGTLAEGKLANVVVTRGDPFTQDDAQVELVFVDGQPWPTESWGRADIRGTWEVDDGAAATTWTIVGTAGRPNWTVDGTRCTPSMHGARMVLRWPCPEASPGAKGAAPARTIVADLHGDRLSGTWQATDGALHPWSARRVAAAVAAGASASASGSAVAAVQAPPKASDPAATYPAGAYGIAAPPRPAAVLVRRATVWTGAAAGRVEPSDLLVRDGRIAAVGRDLAAPPGAVVIEAAGKHVTPGLIDAHSHTAVARGINEGTHSVTAQVRIGDVLDATDINIYRQLAGGVTAANVLHGSANTIGGQSQVIKLRWGNDAQGLVFDAAAPGIKFALGENVKGANWGDGSRYPQTRMGVEQVLRDAFTAARAYAAGWAQWRSSGARAPEPRRDLQYEALVEILERRRLVHVHSYRADEILMFTQVAREFGLEVAAFQHVLEGYKVADSIAGIGAGASTFSDWWAYKMEVMDAVPSNAAMLHRHGVLTSLNSDSNELARRLNTEAAKAVKYGALTPQEALALVTMNPAKQLRIEARTGTLEPGKDADFVIWSGPPLSTFSRVEQTWIEGRRYFDLDADRELRASVRQERHRLLSLALPARQAQLAAVGSAGAGRAATTKGAGDAPPRSELRSSDLGALPWLDSLARLRAWSGSYGGGSTWHECTEDAR